MSSTTMFPLVFVFIEHVPCNLLKHSQTHHDIVRQSFNTFIFSPIPYVEPGRKRNTRGKSSYPKHVPLHRPSRTFLVLNSRKRPAPIKHPIRLHSCSEIRTPRKEHPNKPLLVGVTKSEHQERSIQTNGSS